MKQGRQELTRWLPSFFSRASFLSSFLDIFICFFLSVGLHLETLGPLFEYLFFIHFFYGFRTSRRGRWVTPGDGVGGRVGGGCIYSACPAPLPDALADEVWVCFYGVCVIFGAKFRGHPRPGAHLELQAGSETLWGARGRLRR